MVKEGTESDRQGHQSRQSSPKPINLLCESDKKVKVISRGLILASTEAEHSPKPIDLRCESDKRVLESVNDKQTSHTGISRGSAQS